MPKSDDRDAHTGASSVGAHHLVFVHGFLDDSSIWDATVSELGLGPDTVTRVDLVGADADRERASTVERLTADVVEVIEKRDGPVVLVGQSMGAQVAELAAAATAERTVALVLVTPPVVRHAPARPRSSIVQIPGKRLRSPMQSPHRLVGHPNARGRQKPCPARYYHPRRYRRRAGGRLESRICTGQRSDAVSRAGTDRQRRRRSLHHAGGRRGFGPPVPARTGRHTGGVRPLAAHRAAPRACSGRIPIPHRTRVVFAGCRSVAGDQATS
jgi:pimeloyl-ACP methyl ester carboxylesterase